jgi:dihydroorotase
MNNGGFMGLPETLTMPGAVDLHVHLRDPSTNNAETMESGTRAALLGGYLLIADMPNNPGGPTWSEERILEKHSIIRTKACIPVATYAGSQPESDNVGELARMAPHSIGLKLYGAPTTGNDKDYTAEDFRPIVEEWHKVAPDKPVMFHAGKDNLNDMIGLVTQDLGHHLHVCHVNDPMQVDLIDTYRLEDGPISCGVCPHHLFKNSQAVQTEGWFARMQPPLASQIDSEQLFDQLVSGEIDVVETDHAPHTPDSKWKAEHENPDGIHDPDHTTCFGVPGIEFALPLLFYQARRSRISIERIAEVTSIRPAQILGVKINKGTEVEWDMQEWRIDDEDVEVKGSSLWTPYLGMLAVGTPTEFSMSGRDIPVSTGGWNSRVISQRGEVI